MLIAGIRAGMIPVGRIFPKLLSRRCSQRFVAQTGRWNFQIRSSHIATGIAVGIVSYRARKTLLARCSAVTEIDLRPMSVTAIAQTSVLPSITDHLGKDDEDKPRTWAEYFSQCLESFVDFWNGLSRFVYCSAVITSTAIIAPTVAFFRNDQEVIWEYVVSSVEVLGPTFIKLAQWASSRPDLFP